jgi:hypothetical protein
MLTHRKEILMKYQGSMPNRKSLAPGRAARFSQHITRYQHLTEGEQGGASAAGSEG